ncbi:DNA-processing protein DprA [Paraburkholderia strydomiana]|uniref:DNA-processing protein DprA n=1 Tax=Paraburkholderia strydomiana TaxID=1245417 RepID=UPI0038BCD743
MNVITFPTKRLLVLSMLTGVGPATLRKIAALARFEHLDIGDLSAQFPALARATEDPSAWGAAEESAEKQIIEAQKHEARILSPKDPEYPRLLASTKDDPFLLYVRGNLAPNSEQSVAIIGTREPTQHGQLIAERITQFFAENRWSVVSGLAIGCDAFAHQSAIDAGGHTVAVLAHGLQTIAPARHRKLAEDILSAGGALVSEYPFGREVQKQQYVKRDRTQAGMAQGVVMIQSDLVGGSLHASRAAMDYGRWLAIPYPTGKDLDRGEPKIQANLLIAEGSDAERSELLRCPVSALKNVLVLRSREDYLSMTRRTGSSAATEMEAHGQPEEITSERPVTRNPHEQRETLERSMSREENTADSQTFPGLNVDHPLFAEALHSDPEPPEEALKLEASVLAATSDTAKQRADLRSAPIGHLKILRMPATNVAKSATIKDLIRQPPVALALAALLEYLQARLNVVESAHEQLKHSNGKEGRQFFHLAIDDALSQMERAADFLLVLEYARKPEISGVQDEHNETLRAWTHQIAMLSASERSRLRQREREFFATLDRLHSSSLHRLLLASFEQSEGTGLEIEGKLSAVKSMHISGEAIVGMQEPNVCLEDLVDSFNRLVRRTLYA